MPLSPRFVGPAIGLITGSITSACMTFVGLAVNYGFQPDFLSRWLKSAAISYMTVVPFLMILVPPIQRFVLRKAGIPEPSRPRLPS